MRWRKRDLWKAGIVMAGVLLLLVLTTWVPVSAGGAHQGVSEPAMLGTVTVQATPTVDATVTALSKDQLTQEVAQQQHTWGNWLWSNAATILSSFLSTLVIVVGALFGLWRWRSDRRDAQDKELKDRENEREKRAEERFQSAVTGLGDEKEGARIGAAILLRTFLRPGYEQFYTQTFDLAVASRVDPKFWLAVLIRHTIFGCEIRPHFWECCGRFAGENEDCLAYHASASRMVSLSSSPAISSRRAMVMVAGTPMYCFLSLPLIWR